MNLFSPDTLIEIYEASEIDRLFVVGDLHGCYKEFIHKLEEIQFDFDKDMVISVGDLVDRGEESFKCLELVKQPWFKAIRGNHEQMCLEAWIAPEMQAFHCRHGGQWLYDLSIDLYNEVLELCLHLPIALEVKFKGKKYGFVHADIEINNWSEFKEKLKKNDYYSDTEKSVIHSALWGRGRIKYSFKNKKYKKINGIHKVYLGHTVVREPIEIHNCIFIDTGGVFGGRLTIQEID